MTISIESLDILRQDLDAQSDKVHLAIKNNQPEKLDRIARDIVGLGNAIKDAAYEITKGSNL